jgi:predicted phosphohydrolase
VDLKFQEASYTKDISDYFTQKYSNIYLLDNDILEIDETIFIGTTLWFSFPFTKYFHISNKLNDFKKILIKRENIPLTLLTPTDTQRFFNENIQWLESQLVKYKNTPKKIVVLSHHAPLLENTSYQIDYLGFSTDLGFLFDSYKIDYWLFGHTHKFTDFQYKKTRVLSNPLDELHQVILKI